MASSNQEVHAAIGSNFNRESELKAFDDSKSGVKGLVDAGSSKIPRIFIHDQSIINDTNSSTTHTQFNVPIIDLKGSNARGDIIEKVRHASEEWGFFQITNHGVPKRVLDEMIDGVRGFHEMQTEEKSKFYSRDVKKPFVYTSNFHLFHSTAATWFDSFLSVMAPNPPQSEQLPTVCRDILFEYSNHMMKLGFTLLELFSEALHLKPSHLESMGCGEGLFMVGHYYPPCPQPELTLGTGSHTDAGFFTILLQDLIGGLQVFHQNHWVDVMPLPGALIVNIGDLLQLVTNDKLKSVSHRVLAQKVGPRISLAALFRPYLDGIESKVCRPIEELVSKEKPPVYRETSLKEYVALRTTNGMDGTSSLAPFKVAPIT